MNVELRHLRYFTVLAEELHFGRAATRLNITQPPLTRQIKELERELGARLLERTNRSVTLTEPGRIFLRHALELQGSLREAVEATRRAERGQEGHLSIGYVGAAAYHVLPHVLREFRRRHPGVVLGLHDMRTAEQLESLARGTIDVGLIRPTPLPRGMDSMVILSDSFVVALPSEHRLAHRASIPLAALARENFVTFPVEPQLGLSRQVREMCRGAGFEPRIVQTANETRSIVGLVGAGIGVSIVTSSVQRMRISGVTYRPLAGRKRTAQMVAVWRRMDQAATIRRFLAAVETAGVALEPD